MQRKRLLCNNSEARQRLPATRISNWVVTLFHRSNQNVINKSTITDHSTNFRFSAKRCLKPTQTVTGEQPAPQLPEVVWPSLPVDLLLFFFFWPAHVPLHEALLPPGPTVHVFRSIPLNFSNKQNLVLKPNYLKPAARFGKPMGNMLCFSYTK